MTKNSEIILVKDINIDREYVNVLSYGEQQMLNLCRQKQVASRSDFSFIRTSGNIYTQFTYEQCLQANYIAFQNPDYSNKWFFAFIDDVIYKGNSNTEIVFTVDAWSTWFENWNKKPCFITRQHTNNDSIGANTVPENIDVGEVYEEGYEIYSDLSNNYYFIIMSTYNPFLDRDFEGVSKINGNLLGANIFVFPINDIISISHFIAYTNSKGKIESINSLFIAPKLLMDNLNLREQTGTYQGATFKCFIVDYGGDYVDTVIEVPFPVENVRSFSDYTPKNNKCFVYPYNYLLVSNNIGNQNIYKYEDFYVNGQNTENSSFAIQLAFSIGCSVRLVPRGYKNIDYNYDESLPLAKYPTCSWSADAFTNWLTDNAVNIGTQIVATGVGVATGNIPTVAGNIASLIGQFYQASLLPSIQGGQNTGDVNFSSKSNNFVFHKMRVKTEYLKIIDDYFTRFGYKLNKLETPNIIGRRNWNYVEIGQSEEIGYGTVPTKYMEIINKACRKGVTIWHNHENIGNYNLDNSII